MLHTSAGALSDYWDTAFKFAEGTLILSKPEPATKAKPGASQTKNKQIKPSGKSAPS